MYAVDHEMDLTLLFLYLFFSQDRELRPEEIDGELAWLVFGTTGASSSSLLACLC